MGSTAAGLTLKAKYVRSMLFCGFQAHVNVSELHQALE
jgi:hypothetical protein